MSARFFTLPLAIEARDIDELGHVNNGIYLRWGQDAAVAHWRSVVSADWQQRAVWVVTRHEIDYRAPLLLGDAIEARTWVDEAGPRGPFWVRFVAIGKPGGRPAAEIKSTWCMLDAASRRPKRVPAEIAAAFSGAD